MEGAHAKKHPSTRVSRWAVPVGWVAEEDISPQQLSRPAVLCSVSTIPAPACCRHKGQCNANWLLSFWSWVGERLRALAQNHTRWSPAPPPRWGPSSPQDGSNACPATGCRHPRSRQALTQRPVSHKQKTAFALCVLINHQLLVKTERTGECSHSPVYLPQSHTHTRDTAQPKPEFGPVKTNGRFFSKSSSSPFSAPKLKRYELMSHVTNNSCRMPLSCDWPSSSKTHF